MLLSSIVPKTAGSAYSGRRYDPSAAKEGLGGTVRRNHGKSRIAFLRTISLLSCAQGMSTCSAFASHVLELDLDLDIIKARVLPAAILLGTAFGPPGIWMPQAVKSSKFATQYILAVLVALGCCGPAVLRHDRNPERSNQVWRE